MFYLYKSEVLRLSMFTQTNQLESVVCHFESTLSIILAISNILWYQVSVQKLRYLQRSWKYQWPLKSCDIIIPGSQVSGGAICYLCILLTPPKML